MTALHNDKKPTPPKPTIDLTTLCKWREVSEPPDKMGMYIVDLGHISISKTYKCKKTDQWKDSKYFYKEDLQKLGDMIQLAVGYASDRATHQAEAIASPMQEAKYEAFGDDDIPF